jgi:hypothetical protein
MKEVTALNYPDLALGNDGWIEWKGGPSPLKKGQVAEVKFRSGRIDKYDWTLTEYFWEHRTVYDTSYNVLAYRIIEEPKEEKKEPKKQTLLEYMLNSPMQLTHREKALWSLASEYLEQV